MGKSLDDLLAEMRDNPSGMRFADVCRVASHFFGPPRSRGSSHWVWKLPWPGDPRINLQEGEGGKAKTYQVRQVIQGIARLGTEKKP